LSVVRSSSFLTKRWESIFSNNERLPLTRFGGLSVTINISSEFGLIPKNSRAGSRSESVNLKFTRKSLGDGVNDVFGGVTTWVTQR
jgi:hypothetical protein